MEDKIEQARLAFFGNTIVGTIVTGVLFILGIWSLYENRTKLQLDRPSTRWRVSLAAAAMLAFIVFLLDGMLVWQSWIGNDQGCRDITIPHVLFYYFEKQAVLLFLYDRAKIVHESLRIEGSRLKYLQWLRMLLWLVLVIGIPVTFYWSPFVAFTGVIYPAAGNCVFYVIYPVVPIIFAVSDAILAMGMLLIFLVPLYAHTKGIEGSLAASKVRINRLVRRNIILSSVALVSGFVGLVALSILEWIANEDTTGNSDHFRIYASFAIAFDNFIGVAVIHGMTSGWLPAMVQRHFKLGMYAATSSSANGTYSANNKNTNNKVAGSTNGEDRTGNAHHSTSVLAVSPMTSPKSMGGSTDEN